MFAGWSFPFIYFFLLAPATHSKSSSTIQNLGIRIRITWADWPISLLVRVMMWWVYHSNLPTISPHFYANPTFSDESDLSDPSGTCRRHAQFDQANCWTGNQIHDQANIEWVQSPETKIVVDKFNGAQVDLFSSNNYDPIGGYMVCDICD